MQPKGEGIYIAGVLNSVQSLYDQGCTPIIVCRGTVPVIGLNLATALNPLPTTANS